MQTGIAITSVETLERFSRAEERKKFPFLHLAGSLLQEPKLPELLKSINPVRLEFFDLPPRNVCHLLPDAGKVIREEFIRSFHELCRKAAAFGAAAIEIGVPLDAAVLDYELLRALYGVLYDCRIRPRFSWRLPAETGKTDPLAVLTFFRTLMFDAGLAIAYHPHEPAAAQLDLAELQKTVFISSDAAVHLVYEPDLGNRPGRKLLRKLQESLSRKQSLIFHPELRRQDSLENEWDFLAGLLTEELSGEERSGKSA